MGNNLIWYVARDGAQRGPLSTAELLSLAQRGDVKPDDLLWREGLPTWQTAGAVPGVFAPSGAGPSTRRADSDSASRPQVRDPKLVGVRGWLLLLCVGLIVFQPALTIRDLVELNGEMQRHSAALAGLDNFYLFVMVTSVLVTLASVWVGILLWRVQPGAHILARHFLLLRFAFVCLSPLSIFLFVDVPALGAGAVLGGAATEIGRTAINTVVWYLYLLKSRRVSATFGHS